VLDHIVPGALLLQRVNGNEARRIEARADIDGLLRWTSHTAVDASSVPAVDEADPPQTLVDRALVALDAEKHVRVSGRNGQGKTTLLAAVQRGLQQRGWLTLHYFHPSHGRQIGIEDVRDCFAQQIRRTGLRLPFDMGRPRVLPQAASDAAAWWDLVLTANPGTRIALIADSLDDNEDQERMVAWLGKQGLPLVLAELRMSEATTDDTLRIDLDTWSHTEEGTRAMRAHLARNHPSLVPHHGTLTELSAGRLAWLRLFARGMERSGVNPAEDPRAFYAAHMKWLDERLGGQPGATMCLRHVLLTLAEADFPLSDELLLTLLTERDQGPGRWVDWLPLVLAATADVVDVCDAATAATLFADTLTVYENPKTLVRHIAHPTMAEWLRSGPLPAPWSRVRSEARKALASKCATLTLNPVTAAERYTQLRGLTHLQRLLMIDLAATTTESGAVPVASDGSLEEVVRAVPSERALALAPNATFWVKVTRARRFGVRGPRLTAIAVQQHARALLSVCESESSLRAAQAGLASCPAVHAPDLRLVASCAAMTALRFETAWDHVRAIEVDGPPSWTLRVLNQRARVLLALGRATEAYEESRVAVDLARDLGRVAGSPTDRPRFDSEVREAMTWHGLIGTILAKPRSADTLRSALDGARRAAALGERGAIGDLAATLRLNGIGALGSDPDLAHAFHAEEAALRLRLLPPGEPPEAVATAAPSLGAQYGEAIFSIGRVQLMMGQPTLAARSMDDSARWLRPVAERAGCPSRVRALAGTLVGLGLAESMLDDPRAEARMVEATRLLRIAHRVDPGAPSVNVRSPIARRELILADTRWSEARLRLGNVRMAHALLEPIEVDQGAANDPVVRAALGRCHRIEATGSFERPPTDGWPFCTKDALT
jgi:hypothetical protein